MVLDDPSRARVAGAAVLCRLCAGSGAEHRAGGGRQLRESTVCVISAQRAGSIGMSDARQLTPTGCSSWSMPSLELTSLSSSRMTASKTVMMFSGAELAASHRPPAV